MDILSNFVGHSFEFSLPFMNILDFLRSILNISFITEHSERVWGSVTGFPWDSLPVLPHEGQRVLVGFLAPRHIGRHPPLLFIYIMLHLLHASFPSIF